MKALALFTVLALAACDDPISKGWLVDKTRVLGANVDKGDQTKLQWLVVTPAAPPTLGWAFAVCERPSGNYADPKCPTTITTGSGAPSPGPFVEMTFPKPAIRGSTLVLVAFCPDETPVLDPVSFNAHCPSGAAVILASMYIDEDQTNARPTIPDDAIGFDKQPLPPTSAGAAGSPCEGTPDAPVMKADEVERDLTFRFDAAEREAGESLVLTHVVTGGELDRQYSALDPSEAAPKTVTVKWKAPKAEDVPPEGRLIESWFVLRDGRGGTAFTRRAVCARR